MTFSNFGSGEKNRTRSINTRRALSQRATGVAVGLLHDRTVPQCHNKKNIRAQLEMNKTLFLLLQVITCSLPLVGTGLFAYILFATVGDTSITEWSVSDAFASYPDYQQLLIVLIIASSIIFATTAIRNIQVRIWFRRRYGNYLTSCCRKQQPTNGSNGTTITRIGSVSCIHE